MVDAIHNLAPLKLHQSLHGYVRGHRELASSIKLGNNDAKTVLMYSDLASGYGKPGPHGYLTGYPLHVSGMYALGRTWNDDAARPGAVLTHTIYISFSDLATLRHLHALLVCFRQPAPDGFESFKEPISLEALPQKTFTLFQTVPPRWATGVLAGLYQHPKSPIIIQAWTINAEEVEDAVLAIWSQQWPRLRRSFRFCTLTTEDRSSFEASFDLQILPPEMRLSMPRRFPNAIEAATLALPTQPWADAIIDDLLKGGQEELRTFLRTAAADVENGRSNFVLLCKIFAISTGEICDESEIALVIRNLSSLPPDSAIFAKQELLARALSLTTSLDAETILPMFEWASRLPDTTRERSQVFLANSLLRASPRAFADMLEENKPARKALVSSLSNASPSELAVVVQANRHLLHEILEFNPGVERSSIFWELGPEFEESVLASLDGLGRLNRNLWTWLIANDIQSTSRFLGRYWNSIDVLEILSEYADGMPEQRLTSWLRVCVKDADAVAGFLASSTSIREELLVTIARQVRPRTIPNQYGTDPWLIAFKLAQPSSDQMSHRYLMAFFLTRALERSSKNSGELIQLGFDAVHEAIRQNALEPDAWRLLDSMLISDSWKAWDGCYKLERAVARAFLRQNLWPGYFVRLGTQGESFANLVNAVLAESGGKRFLRSAKELLEDSSNVDRGRVRVLSDALSLW